MFWRRESSSLRSGIIPQTAGELLPPLGHILSRKQRPHQWQKAVAGRWRHWQGNIGTTMTQQPATTTSTRARHHVVVNDGDWYFDNNHDDNVYDDDNHGDDLWKGDGKTEPAAAADAAKAAESVAVATTRADNNQQRAANTAAAAIAVGRRHQARGEKRGRWRWRRGGRGQRRRQGRQRWQRWPVGGGRNKSGDWGSMYTTWQLFGAHNSDASSKCVSGEVPMFGG